ncbi:MAG: Arginine-binding extracellular protein ArtP [Chlamydiae bacterium]|nr:Arginine-binding extracellular protein ArtP [Chlamydiota bacterium]
MACKWKLPFILLSSLLLVSSCQKSSSTYEIGIDPSWYPMQLDGQERNVLAFSIELLSTIGKQEKLPLAIATVSWDNLIWGLRGKKTAAILSSMRPYNFHLKEFSFSPRYLKSGPVIVAPFKSKIFGLRKLANKEIGIVTGSNAQLLLQPVPGLIIHNFPSIPIALKKLYLGEVEAAVVGILIAQKYIRNLYRKELKIASLPLDDEGLRLITLKDAHPALMKKFKRGLTKLKKKGVYEKLLIKWGLSPDGDPPPDLEEKIEQLLQTVL